MKKTLLTLLVVLSLVFCAAAQATVLPNPEAKSYFRDHLTPLGPSEMDDGTIFWAWEHELLWLDIEEYANLFEGRLKQQGIECIRNWTDDDGSLNYIFNDSENGAIMLRLSDEVIYILAPSSVQLQQVDGGQPDNDLPIFNTPEPTEPPITQDYLRGYINGEPVTLAAEIAKFKPDDREYYFGFYDLDGRAPMYAVTFSLPGSIREGNTYRIDKKNSLNDARLTYYGSKYGFSDTIYGFANHELTKGDYVEVTIDYIASGNSEVRGRLSFQCGGGKYTFEDGEFSALVTEE